MKVFPPVSTTADLMILCVITILSQVSQFALKIMCDKVATSTNFMSHDLRRFCKN